MEPIIQIKNLDFDYGEEESESLALNKVSLSIEKGSFVAIIGKNGSGKSTLAKQMNGLLLPKKGSVTIKGMDTQEEECLWDIRQTVGMVFQNPDNQIVSSIVEDDVAFGPENLGIHPDEIRRRVEESLLSVDMNEYRNKAPHLLSGGQKQRIAIAGAIAMRPECIVFDEPTAMLDPIGRAEVLKIIKALNKDGITCILITHFMEEAAEADRIVIMDQGKVAMDGSPKEIFAKSKQLVGMSLDVPTVVKLAHRLRKRGVPLSEDIVNEKDFIEALCQLK